MSEYSVSAVAMTAFDQGVNTEAHNLANVNTRDFQAWSRVYSEGEAGGGPRAVIRDGQDAFNVRDSVSISFLEPSDLDPSAEDGLTPPELMDGNTVDMARETVNLITDQRAFEANAAVIATQQVLDADLLGLIVDQRV